MARKRKQKQPPVNNDRVTCKIRPKNDEQRDYWNALYDSEVQFVAATGIAGSGKTIAACYYASDMLMRGDIQKIILCRSVIPVLGQEIGFVKGGTSEKLSGWLHPMEENFKKFIPNYYRAKMQMQIESMSLAQARGRSFDNTIILLDEAQGAKLPIFEMLMTRIDFNSKLILMGDTEQSDLKEDIKGLDFIQVINTFRDKDWFRHIHLVQSVRNPRISEISHCFSNLKEKKYERRTRQENGFCIPEDFRRALPGVNGKDAQNGRSGP